MKKLASGKQTPIMLPSKQYQEYEREAGYFVKPKDAKIDYPVNVKCLFYMPTRRRVDLNNLISACADLLVHYGVLADDNCRIVVSHDGSRVLYDKENPRTEIVIEALDERVNEIWEKR